MAGIFRFKQFNVDQSGCAMKINTDGVLLGTLTEANQPEAILDIGTGTGVIAMMLAQRFPAAIIDAVEIDEAAANTAKANFINSPFAGKLSLHSSSFQDFFIDHPERKYEFIVSNPPFYINSLQSPGAGKKLAKHADTDFFESLITAIPAHLTDTGLFWLILPIDTAELVKKIAVGNQLYIQQIISVKSYPESDAHRQILSFGRRQTNITQTEFVIYDAPKQYSGQYQTALQDFFTIFP